MRASTGWRAIVVIYLNFFHLGTAGRWGEGARETRRREGPWSLDRYLRHMGHQGRRVQGTKRRDEEITVQARPRHTPWEVDVDRPFCRLCPLSPLSSLLSPLSPVPLPSAQNRRWIRHGKKGVSGLPLREHLDQTSREKDHATTSQGLAAAEA